MDVSKSSSVTQASSTNSRARTISTRIKLNEYVRGWQVLAAMIVLQMLWVIAIWITGATTNFRKLTILGIYTLVTGMVVLLMPASLTIKFTQLKGRLNPGRNRVFAILLISVILIGFVYAFNQRGWTWDEDNSLTAAKMIAEDGVGAFFGNYGEIPWLGNQHPPLIPLVNGFAMRIFGVELLVIRLVSLTFTVGTLVVTYFLGRELYDSNIGLLSSVLLLSFPLILRLGTAALLDMQVTFFFSLALLLTLLLVRSPSTWLSVALGIVLGLGILSKYTMLLIFPLLLVLFVARGQLRNLKFQLAVAAVVSFVMLSLWLLFAFNLGILGKQVARAAYLQGGAVRWAVDGYEDGVQWVMNSIGTKLTSAIGVYNFPLIFLGGFVALWRRSRSDLMIVLWVVTVSALLIFSLPDHRYFMLTFPALAIMMALWLKSRPDVAGKAVLLILLYGAGSLWWFIDWYRAAELFR